MNAALLAEGLRHVSVLLQNFFILTYDVCRYQHQQEIKKTSQKIVINVTKYNHISTLVDEKNDYIQ